MVTLSIFQKLKLSIAEAKLQILKERDFVKRLRQNSTPHSQL